MEAERIYIAPSMLACDFSRIGEELDSIQTADAIHFDVMDGHFVPNLSFGTDILKTVKRVSKLPVDAHLMVQNPEEQLSWYIDAGADSITIHMEAQTHIHRMVYQIKDAGRRACVAINPGTSTHVLTDIIEDVDMVLVMSVNPGFGGQKFIQRTIQKVAEVRALADEKHPSLCIEVDGGVSVANAEALVRAGARQLVAGSSVFSAPSRAQAIQDLRTSAEMGLCTTC